MSISLNYYKSEDELFGYFLDNMYDKNNALTEFDIVIDQSFFTVKFTRAMQPKFPAPPREHC